MRALSVTFEVLDEVAGLPPRYAQKILGAKPVKGFGPISLGCILGALGLRLSVIPDAEALARVEHRLRSRRVRHPVTRKRAGVAAGELNAPPAVSDTLDCERAWAGVSEVAARRPHNGETCYGR